MKPNFVFGSRSSPQMGALNKAAALAFHYAAVPVVNALGYATWSPSSWDLTAGDAALMAAPMLLAPPLLQASAEFLTYRLSRTKKISVALGAGLIGAVAGCVVANEASLMILKRQEAVDIIPQAPPGARPYRIPRVPPEDLPKKPAAPLGERIRFHTPGYNI